MFVRLFVCPVESVVLLKTFSRGIIAVIIERQILLSYKSQSNRTRPNNMYISLFQTKTGQFTNLDEVRYQEIAQQDLTGQS